jgi:hypothetical protein
LGRFYFRVIVYTAIILTHLVIGILSPSHKYPLQLHRLKLGSPDIGNGKGIGFIQIQTESILSYDFIVSLQKEITVKTESIGGF